MDLKVTMAVFGADEKEQESSSLMGSYEDGPQPYLKIISSVKIFFFPKTFRVKIFLSVQE